MAARTRGPGSRGRGRPGRISGNASKTRIARGCPSSSCPKYASRSQPSMCALTLMQRARGHRRRSPEAPREVDLAEAALAEQPLDAVLKARLGARRRPARARAGAAPGRATGDRASCGWCRPKRRPRRRVRSGWLTGGLEQHRPGEATPRRSGPVGEARDTAYSVSDERATLPRGPHLRRPPGGSLREAHRGGRARHPRLRGPARRPGHRGPRRRRVLGEPSARGGLHPGDLAGLPASRASGAAAPPEEPAAPRPAGPRSALPGGGAPRDPPGRLARRGELVVWGTTRAIPSYCFVVEVLGPGLLVVKHRIREDSAKFRNVAVFEGDQVKILSRDTAYGSDPPDLLRSLIASESSGRHGRSRRRAAPPRRVDARAQARGHAAGRARGHAGLARIDRAPHHLRGRAALHRARRSRAGEGRRTASGTARSAGWWKRWPA